jgi:hypothetical protein
MERIACAGMRDIDLARLFLCLLDQVWQRVHVDLVRIGDKHAEETRGERDGREILRRIEWQLLVKTRIGRIGRDVAEQHRVAVRRRLGDEIGAQIGRCAGLVLDDDRLAHKLRHLLSDEPREKIRASARGIRHDQMNGPRRVALRASGLRRGTCTDAKDYNEGRRSQK